MSQNHTHSRIRYRLHHRTRNGLAWPLGTWYFSGMSIDAVIAADRAVLARLEQFARTTECTRLLAAVVEHMGEEGEPWLAHWLVRPAFGLGGLPIDIANKPGGVDLLVDQLARIGHSNCA